MDLLHKQNMLEYYKRKIDSISKEDFNDSQKELIKKILEKMDEEDLLSTYQILAQRVKFREKQRI